MRDESGAAVETLEACIRGAGDWSGFWGDKGGPISTAWAASRRDMFLTQGKSTGTPWPAYTPLERKYYLPVKAWLTGLHKVDKTGLLRWDGRGPEPTGKERLFPGMVLTSNREYVYQVSGNVATMGTKVPYARKHNLGVGAYVRKWRTKRGIKAIPVPTPRRPLLAFGRPFMLAVQNELEQTALKTGGKIGITSSELRERSKIAKAVRGGGP